jgi:hypothetical protein
MAGCWRSLSRSGLSACCGYASEAAARILDLAFDEVGLHRVIGRADANNAGSAPP